MKRFLVRRWSICAAIVLSACAGPIVATHFHSLSLPATGESPVQEPGGRQRIVDIESIAVPAQVDQPQWLVRTPAGALVMLEQERWAAPLGDEIHDALADGLRRRIGALDVSRLSQGDRRATRIRIDVRRFELEYARRVVLDAGWTVQAASANANQPPLVCAAVFEQAVPSGYDALADGQRALTSQLSERLAATLVSMEIGKPSCR